MNIKEKIKNIKKAKYTIHEEEDLKHEERYLDCPYCGVLINEDDNLTEGDEISEGEVITCPTCKKEIKIEGEYI